MDQVDALVVEAVLEARAECSDADRARAALSEALSAARAPARGGARLRGARSTSRWTVTMTVSPASGSKSVEAVIVDDAGAVVAQRTLADRSSRVCLPLARAVGAWASLVLDAELARAKDDDAASARSLQAGGVAPFVGSTSSSTSEPSGPPPALTAGRPARDVGASGGDAEAGAARRSVEIGTMLYLRNGMSSTGGFAGVSPFVTVEVANGWVLRPSLALGRSTSPIPITPTEAAAASHLGARTDFCRRIPGNYIERRGIEADLCAGIEGGIVTSDSPQAGNRPRARFGLGPAANLRGELGAGVALEVRGLLGANVANEPLAEEGPPPLVFAAAELGVSVRF